MANNIDPITGLPPMEFQMPQSQEVEESLVKRLEAGGVAASGKRYLDDRAYQQELKKYREIEDPSDWQKKFLQELEMDYPQIAPLQARIRGIRANDTNYYFTYHTKSGTKMGRRMYEGALREIQGLEGEINRLRTKTVPTQAGLEAFKTTGEGKLITGALEGFERERELLSGISKVRGSAEREMALELKRRLEGIEEQAGVEREFIGQQQTQRGMLRSSFSQERIGESALREQQLKGQERIGTQSRIMSLRDAQQDLVKKIEIDRQKLLTIRSVEEVAEIERARNMMVESHLRTEFQKAMAQAQIDQMKKSSFMGMVTSIANTAMMAYAISCWVARAVFGENDMRWLYARTYVIQSSPNWFYSWYQRRGEEFAKKVKKSKILKLLLKPLFIYFSFKGKKLWQSKT